MQIKNVFQIRNGFCVFENFYRNFAADIVDFEGEKQANGFCLLFALSYFMVLTLSCKVKV